MQLSRVTNVETLRLKATGAVLTTRACLAPISPTRCVDSLVRLLDNLSTVGSKSRRIVRMAVTRTVAGK